MGNTIGVIIPVLNESIHVAASIAQFYYMADDILVLDAGSTDSSVQWANRMGARVFTRIFDYDYSAHYNAAIDQMQTDWIYFHIPDERLEPPLIEVIPKLVSNPDSFVSEGLLSQGTASFDCLGIPRKTRVDGIWTEDYPDYQFRLFKRYCRFQNPARPEITNFTNKVSLYAGKVDRENVSRLNILRYLSRTRLEDLKNLEDSISKGEK